MQGPLKQRYRDDPKAALVTLTAKGELGEGVACNVATSKALVEAGLHPATGGAGYMACSGDMLLEALVACAGVTLRAVATSLGIPLLGGSIRAEGHLDVRGTLGVSRDAPVGFRDIRLLISLDTPATHEEQTKLLELTERYCVVLQTLRSPVAVSMALDGGAQPGAAQEPSPAAAVREASEIMKTKPEGEAPAGQRPS